MQIHTMESYELVRNKGFDIYQAKRDYRNGCGKIWRT